MLLVGCGRSDDSKGPTYFTTQNPQFKQRLFIAVHPLHNPSKLIEAYGPLADYLSTQIPDFKFEVEASRDYTNYERKYRSNGAAFILPNPWQCLDAMKYGYEVIAMAGDPADFKGVFLVRKDRLIHDLMDLKGKTIAFPSPTALAACIMPQWHLHSKGLDVNHDIKSLYVGSQESSIMNAYLGLADVGVTWPPPWRAFCKDHPAEAGQLMVLAETPTLVSNAVMVRKDIPTTVRDAVRQQLLHLHETAAGRRILAGMETARFFPATDVDYEPVRRFISSFEAEIRPVEKY